MAYAQEQLSRSTFAPEGDIVALDFTNVSATTIDLADTDVLGAKVNEGHHWHMIASAAVYVKFAPASSSTDVSATARTTASLNGGASQGFLLPANTLVTFLFEKVNGTGVYSELSMQGASATGVITISKATQNLNA